MAETSENPLLSTARASDTSPTVQLHPLVLLTISDCITRHTLRQQPGPVVGAILGQQNGQEVTMEVAFQAKLRSSNEGIVLDDEWFNKRLDDFKDVHKQPQLDLVGWFTLGSSNGPEPHHLPVHTRISEVYNESPILFLFHPANARAEVTAGGKLPLTLYEGVQESGSGAPNDKAMDIDGGAQAKQLKFRELVYTVETGEAEMISVDFVARGGGNATAVEGNKPAGSKAAAETPEEGSKKGKGKAKEAAKEDGIIDESTVLTAEDEELLSSLNAKVNAIKMLSSRITLLRAYLGNLPPSYLSDSSLPFASDTPPDAKALPIDHSILRSVSALLARIPILAPPDTAAFARESLEEQSDVQLVHLLSSITGSVQAAKEAGRKFSVVEQARNQGRKGMMSGMMGGGFDPSGGGGSGSYLDTVMAGGSGMDGRALRDRGQGQFLPSQYLT